MQMTEWTSTLRLSKLLAVLAFALSFGVASAQKVSTKQIRGDADLVFSGGAEPVGLPATPGGLTSAVSLDYLNNTLAALTLDDLFDTSLASSSDGDVLRYNSGIWENDSGLTSLEAVAPTHIVGPGASADGGLVLYSGSSGYLAKTIPITITTSALTQTLAETSGRGFTFDSDRSFQVLYDPVAVGGSGVFEVYDIFRGWNNISVGPTSEMVLRAGLNNNVRITHGGRTGADYIAQFEPNQILINESIVPVDGAESLGTLGARFAGLYADTALIGDGLITAAQIQFDTAVVAVANAIFKYDDNLSSHGPGFVLANTQGQNVFFVDGDAQGTSGNKFMIYPDENISSSATVRTYRFGVGNTGVSNAWSGLEFKLGAQSFPYLNDPGEEVSYVGVVSAGGLSVSGPVSGAGGDYAGELGRTSFVAGDGKFLGATAQSFMSFIPSSGVFTCDQSDLTASGGGPGTGSDRCIKPSHQSSAAYKVWEFGSGNFGVNGRPGTISVARTFDDAPSVIPGMAVNYASADHPLYYLDAYSLAIPYGTLHIGRGSGTNTNGVPYFSFGDPVIQIAVGSDLSNPSFSSFWSPITWGDAAGRMDFGAYKASAADKRHFRATHTVSAPAYRVTARQVITDTTAAVSGPATGIVLLYGTTAPATATLYDCVSDLAGSQVTVVAANATNTLTIGLASGDTFLSGTAPKLFAVGDSVTLTCEPTIGSGTWIPG